MRKSAGDGAPVSKTINPSRQALKKSAPRKVEPQTSRTLVLDTAPKKSFAFEGRLVINSDIPDDLHIKAGAGIEVNGDVGASILETAGDIRIRNLYGKGLSVMKCGGAFQADSVFDAFVESGGEIKVGDSMKSSLKSSSSIHAGSFIGGEAIAKDNVHIKKAGAPNHLETHISASLDFKVSDRIAEIKARVAQIYDELSALQKHLGAYAHDIEEAYYIKDSKKREKVLDMAVKKIGLEHAVKTKLEEELRRLNAEIISAPESEICIDDILLNGVVVEIGHISKRLDNDLKGPLGIFADVENNSLKFEAR